MSGKKVTPNQMRKGLTYVQQGPDFMRMLTGQSSNSANSDPRYPYRKPDGIEAKFQTEAASDDEDETAHDILNEREEERPMVVVLKDGKHLDERQVRNILKSLPPGLSEAEIQKKLAEETEKLGRDGSNANQEGEDDEEEEEEQGPLDGNGKILFRRPKGSKKASSTMATTSSSSSSSGGKKEPTASAGSVKSFEESLFGEAQTKANGLKRKSGVSSTSSPASTTSKGATDSTSADKKGDGKKKKQKTAKTTTSLLSFGDEE